MDFYGDGVSQPILQMQKLRLWYPEGREAACPPQALEGNCSLLAPASPHFRRPRPAPSCRDTETLAAAPAKGTASGALAQASAAL